VIGLSFSVLGTGMYVPPKEVTNHDLSQFLETSDEWIQQRVGVVTRHISTGETASDMAYHAAVAAIENSGCSKDEIDLIIAATISGERVSPSVSSEVQERLGVSCVAFDINAACSAFIFLLETAAGFFARGYKKILVIGAERNSRIIDWHDRNTAVIFGDGAGAVVLGEGNNYLDSTITVRGGHDVINIPNFIGNSPYYQGVSEEPYIQMSGQETFKFAVNAISNDLKLLLQRNDLNMEQIRWIVPHQANKRIIDMASVKLKVPLEKFFLNIQKYGNTSSASIPIALDEMHRSGQLQPGDLLLLTAFGGGLAHASCLLRW
jgi:3-oxoacyl-[acyl-carrier-protein] synthase-3